MRRDQAGHTTAALNTVTWTTDHDTTPGWLWASGTNTARPSSGGLETGPSGILLEASMTYSTAARCVLAGGAR